MQLNCNFLLITFLGFSIKNAFGNLKNDFVDLLSLPDNDEFVWHKETSSAFGNGSSFEQIHHFTKRQAVNGGNNFLENRDFGACNLPTGESGRCRHIIYCRLPELKNDVWKLVSQLCVIEQSKIGICCPDYMYSRVGPQIVTETEANDVEAARIINRPEQRGCGMTTKQFPRITGGRQAEPDEWPWMAAIIRPGSSYVWCGGSLITDRHVLTAAHCLHKLDKNEIFVRLGEYNTAELNETRAREFRIANMVTHIDYDPLTYENDIGIIRIDRPTLFNTYIWPVCMPPVGENWENSEAAVIGWGTQSFGGPHSEILMEVLIPVWKQDDCRNVMVERLPDTVLCASKPEGGQDSCQGDSGGPLLIQLPNQRWVTIGIVSWGVNCAEVNRPGLYTRVNRYLHWIIENADI